MHLLLPGLPEFCPHVNVVINEGKILLKVVHGTYIQGGPSALGKIYVYSKFEVAFSRKFIL